MDKRSTEISVVVPVLLFSDSHMTIWIHISPKIGKDSS